MWLTTQGRRLVRTLMWLVMLRFKRPEKVPSAQRRRQQQQQLPSSPAVCKCWFPRYIQRNIQQRRELRKKISSLENNILGNSDCRSRWCQIQCPRFISSSDYASDQFRFFFWLNMIMAVIHSMTFSILVFELCLCYIYNINKYSV